MIFEKLNVENARAIDSSTILLKVSSNDNQTCRDFIGRMLDCDEILNHIAYFCDNESDEIDEVDLDNFNQEVIKGITCGLYIKVPEYEFGSYSFEFTVDESLNEIPSCEGEGTYFNAEEVKELLSRAGNYQISIKEKRADS